MISPTDEMCQCVEGHGDSARPCDHRAEYAVSTLIDALSVCPSHLGWARDLLRAQGERSRYDYDSTVDIALLHPQDWPSGIPGLWTTRQAADYWGVKPATYRDYISAGYAPPPSGIRDPATGAKLHRTSEVRLYHRERRGQGHRSDLRAK